MIYQWRRLRRSGKLKSLIEEILKLYVVDKSLSEEKFGGDFFCRAERREECRNYEKNEEICNLLQITVHLLHIY